MIMAFQFCLGDLSCPSRSASGRSVSESWNTAGHRSPPMLGKPVSIPVPKNWRTWRYLGCPLAAAPPHVCRLHSQALPLLKQWRQRWRGWLEVAQPGGLPTAETEMYGDWGRGGGGAWRCIRSDKEATPVPAYHPHAISTIKQEQDRKALRLKRCHLQH